MKLVRFYKGKDLTLGRLTHAGRDFYTVERPWADNKPNISCIPDGNYKLKRVDSPKFGADFWEIADVPNRTHILIHVANTANNVQGCIGLGTTVYNDLGGVGSSRVAIGEFYKLTSGLDEEDITIYTGALS